MHFISVESGKDEKEVRAGKPLMEGVWSCTGAAFCVSLEWGGA